MCLCVYVFMCLCVYVFKGFKNIQINLFYQYKLLHRFIRFRESIKRIKAYTRSYMPYSFRRGKEIIYIYITLMRPPKVLLRFTSAGLPYTSTSPPARMVMSAFLEAYTSTSPPACTNTLASSVSKSLPS